MKRIRCMVAVIGFGAARLCWADAIPVAVCGASYENYVEDVQTNLANTARFTVVDAIDVRYSTPALTTLQNYAALLVFSDLDYADATNFGNVLADYVDGGGGVVAMLFEVASLSFVQARRVLHGRWESGGYVGIPRGDWKAFPETRLGTVHQAGHPVMHGVTNFSGGARSYRPAATNVNTGWARIADWSDGVPLVVAAEINGGRVVNLAFYPVSDMINTGFWHTAGDGAVLMANALEWAAVPEPAGVLVAAGVGMIVMGMRRRRRPLERGSAAPALDCGSTAPAAFICIAKHW